MPEVAGDNPVCGDDWATVSLVTGIGSKLLGELTFIVLPLDVFKQKTENFRYQSLLFNG